MQSCRAKTRTGAYPLPDTEWICPLLRSAGRRLTCPNRKCGLNWVPSTPRSGAANKEESPIGFGLRDRLSPRGRFLGRQDSRIRCSKLCRTRVLPQRLYLRPGLNPAAVECVGDCRAGPAALLHPVGIEQHAGLGATLGSCRSQISPVNPAHDAGSCRSQMRPSTPHMTWLLPFANSPVTPRLLETDPHRREALMAEHVGSLGTISTASGASLNKRTSRFRPSSTVRRITRTWNARAVARCGVLMLHYVAKHGRRGLGSAGCPIRAALRCRVQRRECAGPFAAHKAPARAISPETRSDAPAAEGALKHCHKVLSLWLAKVQGPRRDLARTGSSPATSFAATRPHLWTRAT